MAISCPACNKTNQADTACSRCGCDLTRLRAIVAGAAAAMLCRRLGIKRLLIFAALLYGAGCVIAGFAPTIGVLLAARLAQAGHAVVLAAVLPDEREQIAARLQQLAAGESCDAIFTTGGTGLSARDVTPEATRSAIEREIPGFGELMRAEGVKSNRRAALSRSMAGTLARTVIVNLPGSPKGAVESLNAILDLVPHVV